MNITEYYDEEKKQCTPQGMQSLGELIQHPGWVLYTHLVHKLARDMIFEGQVPADQHPSMRDQALDASTLLAVKERKFGEADGLQKAIGYPYWLIQRRSENHERD